MLASLFFIYRMSDLTRVERLPSPSFRWCRTSCTRMVSQRVVAYSLYGTLFFGAIHKLETLLDPAERHPSRDPRRTTWSTWTPPALKAWKASANPCKRGCALILCNLNPQPASLIRRSGFEDAVGINNICGDIYGALARSAISCPGSWMKTTSDPAIRLLRIRGHVQGVGYRNALQSKPFGASFRDGSATAAAGRQALVAGPVEDLWTRMIAWARRRAPAAVVAQVTWTEAGRPQPSGFARPPSGAICTAS